MAFYLGSTIVAPLTSGTSFTPNSVNPYFTGIPSWSKRITMFFYGLGNSTYGNANMDMCIQVGTSSGFIQSGYFGASGEITNNSGIVSYGGYFNSGLLLPIRYGGNYDYQSQLEGKIEFLSMGSSGAYNYWIITAQMSLDKGGQGVFWGSAGVTLSGTLDRVGFTALDPSYNIQTYGYNLGLIQLIYE